MSYNLRNFSGLNLVVGNFNLGGISGAATTHSHTASLVTFFDGKLGTAPSGTTTPTVNSSPADPSAVGGAKAAGQALSVTAPSAGVVRAALVCWTIDAAGTKRIRSRGFFDGQGSVGLEFPSIPADEHLVAYVTIKAGSTVSGTWTHGSSNWNATGITAGTPVQCNGMPGSPGAIVVS